ncbi:MAG: 16S rRNA (adenine(1518)-N(6)/adenine(1519)-N(6))-dimethyltransferase RsmA [Pseudomonadota bacterium]
MVSKGSFPAIENLPPLREVISEHNLRAEKSLGQNFLLDQNITDKIARHAGDLSDKNVIEIGPGPGGLTRSLLKAGAQKVIAVEFDQRAVSALEGLKHASDGRLEILHADALETNLVEICDAPRVIVANLPYNIATSLLIGWLKDLRADARAYDQMILMFQKEVAERIAAQPNNKSYGRLSVMSQWICDVQKVFDLPASAFTPPPKVKSSVVKFTPRGLADDAPSFEKVEAIVAAAFGQRRKMIRSSLSNYSQAIEKLEINPELRAENLTVEQYIFLANLLT